MDKKEMLAVAQVHESMERHVLPIWEALTIFQRFEMNRIDYKITQPAPSSKDPFMESFFQRDDLARTLVKIIGMPTGRSMGKYRLADTFVLGVGDKSALILRCEEGDKGSTWYFVENRNEERDNGNGYNCNPGMGHKAWMDSVEEMTKRLAMAVADIDDEEMLTGLMDPWVRQTIEVGAAPISASILNRARAKEERDCLENESGSATGRVKRKL